MTLSATINVDAATGKPVLIAKSDPRVLTVTVDSPLTDPVTVTAVWPALTIVDSSGHTWTLRSDDGTTAVYGY